MGRRRSYVGERGLLGRKPIGRSGSSGAAMGERGRIQSPAFQLGINTRQPLTSSDRLITHTEPTRHSVSIDDRVFSYFIYSIQHRISTSIQKSIEIQFRSPVDGPSVSLNIRHHRGLTNRREYLFFFSPWQRSSTRYIPVSFYLFIYLLEKKDAHGNWEKTLRIYFCVLEFNVFFYKHFLLPSPIRAHILL